MSYTLFGKNLFNDVQDVVKEINSNSKSVSKEINSIIERLREIMRERDAGRIEELECELKDLYSKLLPASKEKFRGLLSEFQKKGDKIYSLMQRIHSHYENEMKREEKMKREESKREEKMNREDLKERLAGLVREGEILKANYRHSLSKQEGLERVELKQGMLEQDEKADVERVGKKPSFANKVGNNHKSNVVKCPVASQVAQERTAISSAHPYKVIYNIHPIGRDGLAQEQDKEKQVLILSFETEREEISCMTQLPYLDQTSIRFEDENLHKWYKIRFQSTLVKKVAKLICSKR